MRPDVLAFPEDRRTAATLGVDERAAFLGRTYAHLLGALALFVVTEIVLFQATSVPEAMISFLAGGSWRWLLFLGAFMVVGMLASRTAMAATTPLAQYAALGGYVVVEALVFVPLLFVADLFAPGAIHSAALVSLVGFTGLTGVVFITRKDFSFLRAVVLYGGVVALLLIVGGVAFGLDLGTWFSVGMVALAGAAILYDTSNVLHHYPADRHVAAALALFAAVALLFWYVLRLFLAFRE